MVTNKIEEIVKAIESMSVMEVSTLVKQLEEKFGIQAPTGFMAAGGAVSTAASSQAQAVQEEKTTFTVILVSAGANKIPAIKEVRAITNLGLKEAKDLVDSCPKPIKEHVSKEEAEEIKKKLTAVGATVELK